MQHRPGLELDYSTATHVKVRKLFLHERKGIHVGVTNDIDGQTRPFNGSFDIGCDELRIYPHYLPLVLKDF